MTVPLVLNEAATPTYDRDPAAIYARSFAIIRAEAPLGHLPDSLHGVAIRVVHACGMVDIAGRLAFQGDVAGAGRAALAAGAPVIADCRMVASGVIRRRLPAGNAVLCGLDDPRTDRLAAANGTTRSAAAIDALGDRIAGAVVAIGNAPTALFRLIEIITAGGPRPAAILAFPVGFVGAAESKQALLDAGLAIPCLTLPGRMGGSAMASAAVNAIAAPNEEAL